jgi:catechol 2,3-dioxygenase-like lactoylglutathione lyase family enzyme
MANFDHVNISVPEGGVDAEQSFLEDVLGYQRIDPGPEATARGAIWFEFVDGSQVHLSVDPDHRPSKRTHTALHFGDDLPLIEDRLTKAFSEIVLTDALNGHRVILCCDPAGNRWELRG